MCHVAQKHVFNIKRTNESNLKTQFIILNEIITNIKITLQKILNVKRYNANLKIIDYSTNDFNFFKKFNVKKNNKKSQQRKKVFFLLKLKYESSIEFIITNKTY